MLNLLDICNRGQYISKVCSNTALAGGDATCTSCSGYGSEEYKFTACTGVEFSDVVACTSCSTCTHNIATECSPTSDTVCCGPPSFSGIPLSDVSVFPMMEPTIMLGELSVGARSIWTQGWLMQYD
jgi:hypothetical protein